MPRPLVLTSLQKLLSDFNTFQNAAPWRCDLRGRAEEKISHDIREHPRALNASGSVVYLQLHSFQQRIQALARRFDVRKKEPGKNHFSRAGYRLQSGPVPSIVKCMLRDQPPSRRVL